LVHSSRGEISTGDLAIVSPAFYHTARSAENAEEEEEELIFHTYIKQIPKQHEDTLKLWKAAGKANTTNADHLLLHIIDNTITDRQITDK